MNKTIIININGIVFHIEEEAYDALRSYMIDVKKHFGHSADSHEIVGDIENRIAEMFNERIVAGKNEVITMTDVQDVIGQMGTVSDFSDEEIPADNFENNYQNEYQSTQRKFMRDPDDRVLGGVCSGLGHYFGTESRWIRLLFIVLFLTAGTGILIYLILWMIVPVAKSRADRMAMRGEAANIKNFKRSFQEEMEGLRSNFTGAEGSVNKAIRSAGNVVAKLIVIIAKVFGVLFIVGICIGLITLLISIVTSFGYLDAKDMAMFPLNIIRPEYRNTLLISSITIALIPIIALIGVIIRILFNRPVIGKYTGFAMLAIWLIAIGITTVYSLQTANDFREESTVVEERRLEAFPVYYLNKEDLSVIRLQDSTVHTDRMRSIQQTAVQRNSSFLRNQRRVYIYFNSIDSMQQPSITYEYHARGENYEMASQRAGKIKHNFLQQGPNLTFDSHFSLEENELMRDQGLSININLPIGSKIILQKDLRRNVRNLPFSQCEENYESKEGYRPEKTEWVMTHSGLKCAVEMTTEMEIEETANPDSLSWGMH